MKARRKKLHKLGKQTEKTQLKTLEEVMLMKEETETKRIIMRSKLKI